MAIPGLSEEANRLLAHALARQLVHATCSELLADLLIAEGLMGASVTRTHATAGTGTATFSPASTHGTSSGGTRSAPATTHGGDPHLTAGPPPLSPRTTQFAIPAAPPPLFPPPAPAHAAPRERSAWPIIIFAMLLLMLMFGGGGWYLWKSQTGGKLSFLSKTTVLRLQGDVPPHAIARIGSRELPIERSGETARVEFDGSATPLPATVVIEAKGFAPAHIALGSAADLERPHDASLKRSEGTLVFTNRVGSDYEHAVLKMTAQLPDEQAYVELERFNRGVELSAAEAKLPTGIYQLTLRGANERIVRPRVFTSIAIKPEETTTFALPPPMTGTYTGSVTVRRDGAKEGQPSRVELIIDADITTGSFVEHGKRGRRLPLIDGRIDLEGTYIGRIQFSLAPDGDPQFDQIFTLKRDADGALLFAASESPDENPTVERHLNRQPYAKTAYSVEGTLRPAGK
jgi:hypothetical protein